MIISLNCYLKMLIRPKNMNRVREIYKTVDPQKEKAKRLNSVRGTQRFTRPSQSFGDANVVINHEM